MSWSSYDDNSFFFNASRSGSPSKTHFHQLSLDFCKEMMTLHQAVSPIVFVFWNQPFQCFIRRLDAHLPSAKWIPSTTTSREFWHPLHQRQNTTRQKTTSVDWPLSSGKTFSCSFPSKSTSVPLVTVSLKQLKTARVEPFSTVSSILYTGTLKALVAVGSLNMSPYSNSNPFPAWWQWRPPWSQRLCTHQPRFRGSVPARIATSSTCPW